MLTYGICKPSCKCSYYGHLPKDIRLLHSQFHSCQHVFVNGAVNFVAYKLVVFIETHVGFSVWFKDLHLLGLDVFLHYYSIKYKVPKLLLKR